MPAKQLVSFWVLWLCLFAWVGGLAAQPISLSLGPATPGSGSAVTLELSLAAPAGSQPASLQWTLSYPAMALSGVSLTAGPALTAAGKTLTCVASAGAQRCVATGLSSQSVAAGVVAVATATVLQSASVSLGGVLGALLNGALLSVNTGGTVSVSPRSALPPPSTPTLPTPPPPDSTPPPSSTPPAPGPSLTTFQCSPLRLKSGQIGTCILNLDKPAPAGGISLTLSSGSNAITMPRAVTVAAGTSSTAFLPKAGSPATDQSVVLSAVYGGVSKTVTLAVLAAAPAFTPIRVNAGGLPYTDAQGRPWSADTNFSGGNSWKTESLIRNTTATALYQSARFGVGFTYQFAVPNGSYTVNLKFAEGIFTVPGQRVFNVAINSSPALSNFDIVAQAGAALTAISKSIPVTVTTGQIAIQFSRGSVNYPMINAIEILPGNAPTGASLAASAVRLEAETLPAEPAPEGLPRLLNGASRSAQLVCSPGAMATVSGEPLLDSGASLESVQVRVNQELVPVLDVQPDQVSFLCPELALGTPLEVSIEIPGGIIGPLEAEMQELTPGLFSLDGTGRGQGLIRVLSTSSLAMAGDPDSSQQPGQPGDAISILATGLGHAEVAYPLLLVGDTYVEIESIEAQPFTGIYEIRARIPEGAAWGDEVPVLLQVPGPQGELVNSNTVVMAIGAR